jgi:glycosyltransferase involved in cell wall biosynthesis
MKEESVDLPEQPLVSVVTPVYNGEEYLAECVESVLAQTYRNWEYIIVDNRSTDRSLEIAQRYARQDRRIDVQTNVEFLSQFRNWNHAMRQISPKSRYCKVVHADDWLFPECIARMVALAEAHPTVGIVGAYRLDESKVNLDGLPYPSTVTPGREICRLYLLGGPRVFGSPTSLLLRSDLVRSRSAFYDESVIHADAAVCFELLQDWDFGYVHQVLTYTRRHNESITSLTHSYNTRRLANLMVILRYGPVYLGEAEYKARWAQAFEHYHRFLAHSFFDLKGRAFWRFHREELKKLGHPIGAARLTRGILLQLLDVRQTTRIVRRALERRRGTASQGPRNGNALLSSIYSREA